MLVFIINCQKPKYGREFYLSFGLFGYIFDVALIVLPCKWMEYRTSISGHQIENIQVFTFFNIT